jgi:putative heme-binding domain-containing protein
LNSKVKHAVVAAKRVKHFWYNVDARGSSGFAAPAEVEFVEYDPPKRLSATDRKLYKLGAEVYQRESHCATCHLTHGKGNGIVYPSLVRSPWVNGDEERLVKMALHGLWGKITVHGKSYDPARGVPPMTAFRDLLSDEELAAVLTFVRNTWGNEASTVSAETVKRVRAETSGRTVFWTPDELLAEHPLEEELMTQGVDADAAGFSNKELEDELLAISASELAKVARKQGDAERGKKLFYRSAAACASCHDPARGAPQIGPDLATLKTELKPEELVDSVLRPSKRIDEAYVQIKVLTVDGNIRTGLRLSETDEELVLGVVGQPKPVVIPQDDIEQVAKSQTSLMPANLARLLKDRSEFNDLIKYIMEVRKR